MKATLEPREGMEREEESIVVSLEGRSVYQHCEQMCEVGKYVNLRLRCG